MAKKRNKEMKLVQDRNTGRVVSDGVPGERSDVEGERRRRIKMFCCLNNQVDGKALTKRDNASRIAPGGKSNLL